MGEKIEKLRPNTNVPGCGAYDPKIEFGKK